MFRGRELFKAFRSYLAHDAQDGCVGESLYGKEVHPVEIPIFLFWSRNRYGLGGSYFIFLVIMFQIITASFLAVALTAECLPFLNATLLKKSERCVSFRLPIALAACLRAIFNRLLPFGTLLLRILPPDILLFGASLNQEVKCFGVGNFLKPSGPISLMMLRMDAWESPSMAKRSTPSKYLNASWFMFFMSGAFLFIRLCGFSVVSSFLRSGCSLMYRLIVLSISWSQAFIFLWQNL